MVSPTKESAAQSRNAYGPRTKAGLGPRASEMKSPPALPRCAQNPPPLESLGITLARLRLLPSGERLAVARPDDERAVLGVVELRRVGGLVAAHAHRRAHLGADVAGRVLDVLAAGAVARLALHVATPEAAPVQALAAELGAIDAADAARLLPATDVAVDAVEAELLLHRDQRLVRIP